MVTCVPGGPAVGEICVIVGGGAAIARLKAWIAKRDALSVA
jgi:hypothetical protein